MNLHSTFLNVDLENPIIIASSPLTESIENIERCFFNGAGGIIAKTCTSHLTDNNGFRRCYFNSKGVWITSGYNREIQDVKLSKNILQESIAKLHKPIFASVTESTLNSEIWLQSCNIIADSGVSGIQLDFFYIDNLIGKDDFKSAFIDLLGTLKNKIGIPIFPKLNINLPAKFISEIFIEADIKAVSLLDSIKVCPPFDIFKQGKGRMINIEKPYSTSLFGTWQYPLTLKYTYEMVKSGLETCSGGGIQNVENIIELLMLGSSAVQIASEVLFNGYSRIIELKVGLEKFLITHGYRNLKELKSLALTDMGTPDEVRYLNKKVSFNSTLCNKCQLCVQQVFCNAIKFANYEIAIDMEKCEGCNLCVSLCPSNALYFS